MEKKPIFTVDLEDWNDALHIASEGHSSDESWWWLLYKLQDYEIKAVFYALDYFIKLEQFETLRKCLLAGGHQIKTHGKWHRKWENADRKPYQRMGFTGGFWFRILPLWFIKRCVIKEGMFYIHPHDLDENHPKIKNPWLNWKRHVGLKNSRKKLERLLSEVQFGDPS